MVCDDKQCLPPEALEFEIDIAPGTIEVSEEFVEEAASEEASTETAAASLTGSIQHDQPSGGILQPIKWSFSAEKISDKEYNLVATATLDPKWHLYSQNLESMDGPVPTQFRFNEKDGNFKVVGKTEERGEIHKEFDPNFEMELSFYEHEVSFAQRIRFEGEPGIAKGDVYFMVCDDKNCLPPEEIVFEINTKDAVPVEDSAAASGGKEKSGKSLWEILLYSFLGGLGALLTPCVFPMIPMTVSFFTKQSKTRVEGIKKGVTYGMSIILIYVLCSVPFHLFTSVSPDIFNEFSTNPILNLTFFAIFIIFAVSFLGAFEITLPSSWVNKADRAADKGGMVGIFFMALTLILVSFSCTGPAIGLLLGSVLSTDGGATYLSVGLFGFGLGLGLPFGLFAAFPGWLHSLPQSGGWLNSVKVVFGFLELAFAFKFLSNADLVVQAGLLTREVFIAIWIAVSFMLALYLLGVYRLPHDSPTEKISVGRSLLATLTLAFTIYLIPGLWGAPLKLISGFPPPMFYSESPQGVGKTATIVSSSNSEEDHAGSGGHSGTCPHNLNCFHDYDEGMAYAKKVGKPVMLDFTGWACVNCRRMEEQVWSEEPVLKRLRKDVVLISLYVDEKKELPESEKYVSDATGKSIKTVGNKWSDFQITRYESNTQPYYVIIDHDENQLVESASYDPDVALFVDWLDRGKKAFEKGKH
ncbi:thioredoxin family protein [bacterium SCSIO 12741]|nr:thioredoxin family protein [bacterium SCSIO 12741]